MTRDMKYDQGKVMPLEDLRAPSFVKLVSRKYRESEWYSISMLLESEIGSVPITDLVLNTAAVLHYGAQKYAWDSWQTVPNALYRYLNAWARHAYPERYYPDSPVNDPETGFPHEWHAQTNIVFCLKLLEEQ